MPNRKKVAIIMGLTVSGRLKKCLRGAERFRLTV